MDSLTLARGSKANARSVQCERSPLKKSERSDLYADAVAGLTLREIRSSNCGVSTSLPLSSNREPKLSPPSGEDCLKLRCWSLVFHPASYGLPRTRRKTLPYVPKSCTRSECQRPGPGYGL